MDSRREFIKKSVLLSGAAGFSTLLPASVQRAFAIDPPAGSTYLDAEHIVILMQENRSFDHCFGSLQGVRGFNDPRAITLPDKKPVWLQTNEKGETYAPFRLDMKDTKVTWMGDLPHSRPSQVDAHNAGKYDKWLTAKRSGNKKYAGMPLTLGYYNRTDLPFNYGMADAFTVCDQHFSSAMTSTTPNRSFFWTGKVSHEQDGVMQANMRNENFSYGKMPWKTFPELLQENDIAWKFYQNEISCGGGFKGEERSWLANFGCNLLEFFAAFNVKFSPRYIQNLQKLADELPGEINKLQEESPSTDEAAKKIQAAVAKKQEALDNAKQELNKWNTETFQKLPEKEKALYRNAFVVNNGDPSYHNITTLQYKDGNAERTVTVPEGDVLYQFRKDVNESKLPTVSWLASPQNFSDHPSAPWYGAWYVSEILDILTKNPEVWKKTIFILTYDENDGYFDHVPPFSVPDNNKPETGKCSAGIDTEIEHVRMESEHKLGVAAKQAREAPIGLGFRVPMIVASPWSRGGKVCSAVYDHTSTLQFLETFVNKKFNKNIRLDHISRWRRTICGDLTEIFSPFNGNKVDKVPFLTRDPFVEAIYNAKFKEDPSGYKQFSEKEIDAVIQDPAGGALLPGQEKGIRPSNALPYELYADSKISAGKKELVFQLKAGSEFFGAGSAGSPFTIYAPGKFTDEKGVAETARNWSFAVSAGDTLSYSWPVAAFEYKHYHLRLYGPNGFYRECTGNDEDPILEVNCLYETGRRNKKPTGNIILGITNANPSKPLHIEIRDNAYGKKTIKKTLTKATAENIVLNLKSSYGWYDFSIKAAGFDDFEKRYAGRVETGKESFTDPFMGRVAG
ncbi:phosphocholine-specific phospholipase C [Agriterribacter sp.]|uniref:phosphocholine-specific phospholipase C n=1 Tax=Agriterribacter sp. TaxID=2821509 RepID=UPI002CF53A18|nr:phospholipase C, phosphocholine-specific [Agriterribacter sp.]HTN06049.1 phospholipase C, phosphocholine-specific [Agriterribacter sp.]